MENIQSGVEISLQPQDVQDWFNADIMPKIDFADTCNVRDEFERPSEWHFTECVVKAVYFTENVNYNFNKFLLYGII